MNRPQRLTTAFVKAVDQPGRYGDGRGSFGLSLLVKESRRGLSKTWAQRLRVGGRTKSLGLGAYQTVSLVESRQQAASNALTVMHNEGRKSALEVALESAAGISPQGLRVRSAAARAIPTFRQVVEESIALRRGGWKEGGKTEAQVRSLLERYAYPVMGIIRIDLVTSGQIVEMLKPLWHDKPETARKTLRNVSQVFDYAMSKDYRADDPTVKATIALPKKRKRVEHHRALPYREVGKALETVEGSTASESVKLCLPVPRLDGSTLR